MHLDTGPGPNEWVADNVYVDGNGYLHLKITYDSSTSTWQCAELYTTNKLSFGFGTYQWWLVSDLEFDENVVLGLFLYGESDLLDEIDIEFAKFGDATGDNAVYAVYPATSSGSTTFEYWTVGLGGTFTTQRIAWQSQSIEFTTIGGHYNIDTTTNVIKNWQYAPCDYTNNIPQNDLTLHMNLWLFQGQPPTDSQEVEVVIRGFQYN